MATNKTAVDRIHDLLPKHLNTRTNINWKGIIDAIGSQDQLTSDLVSDVRKQFFVKTASRPYIDRLAANNRISRPRLVGMDDTSFREYIPVLSYSPKQVKLIIDELLDIFFFKESTTAYMTTTVSAPFALQDGWELEYIVDENESERIEFNTADFVNIAAATANEVVSAINRQATKSYATAFYDSVSKNTYIRLFTKTVGSKGSLRITGGRADIALRFNGFIATAGNGNNTQWSVTKIGDEVTMQHIAGVSPGIDQLQTGDIIISNLTNNIGSFVLTEVNLSDSLIKFKNLFGTPGTFTQTSSDDVKFVRASKIVAYTNPRRAMTWETSPGEIVVEMPTSPPVVKRSLQGSYHINGPVGVMTSRDSDTSLTLVGASTFPNSGTFYLEEQTEIQTRIKTSTENTVITRQQGGRIQYPIQKYEFTSRTILTTTGDIVAGQSQIINLASTIGLAIGQSIEMDGVPLYATITNVAGPVVTMSFPATKTANGEAVSFLGNQLTGITPPLPAVSSLNEFSLSSLSRASNLIVTGVTSAPHGFLEGETVVISDNSGILVFTTTGNTAIGSNQLTALAGVSGIGSGQLIDMSGVPAGTTVLSILGNTVTMSANATAANTGASVTFNENLNVSAALTSASGSTFTFNLIGADGSTTTPGGARVERIGMSNSGSKVILSDAISRDQSRITGAYVWDLAAPFVLSSLKADIQDEIKAGTIVRLLNTSASDIPAEGGFVIFDYGLNTQEGPVRYLYKPTATTIAIDPSYTFQKNHDIGSAVVSIRSKGPHLMSTVGSEYPPYITDPSQARFILQDLIRSVKSAGIFVNFLIRYPEQLYATLDVYSSGVDPG